MFATVDSYARGEETAIFKTNIPMESSKKGLAWHNQTKKIGLVSFRFFAGDGASWMPVGRPIRRKMEAVRQPA